MPRPNQTRLVEGESNLARRVQIERELAGLSYEALARLMTEAGCAIQGSAIYKIEKGDPPRRITVDELIAFATAFGTTTEDLLTPIALIRQNQGREIAERVRSSLNGLYAAAGAASESLAAYYEITLDDEELSEYIENMAFRADDGGGPVATYAPTLRGRKVPSLEFSRTVEAFWKAIIDLTVDNMDAATTSQRKGD